MLIAFTGAGISRPSGIPTFEERPDLRDKLDYDVWCMQPEVVWEAVWEMRHQTVTCLPNAAHIALAEAEVPVITQNIDGLHQRAGTNPDDVLELHGNLRDMVCQECQAVDQLERHIGHSLPKCSCGGLFKPDVVLYQEAVPKYWTAFELVAQSTTLLVIGTSLTVNPAAQLPEYARRAGVEIVLINQQAENEVPRFLKRHVPT